VRAAGDEGQDITPETVAIAVSRCQAPGRSEKSARVPILLRKCLPDLRPSRSSPSRRIVTGLNPARGSFDPQRFSGALANQTRPSMLSGRDGELTLPSIEK